MRYRVFKRRETGPELGDLFSTIDQAAYWLMLVYGLVVLAVPGWKSLLAAVAAGCVLFAWPWIAESLRPGPPMDNPLMFGGGVGAAALYVVGAGLFLVFVAGRLAGFAAKAIRRFRPSSK